jgi:hypothetical protein
VRDSIERLEDDIMKTVLHLGDEDVRGDLLLFREGQRGVAGFKARAWLNLWGD